MCCFGVAFTEQQERGDTATDKHKSEKQKDDALLGLFGARYWNCRWVKLVIGCQDRRVGWQGLIWHFVLLHRLDRIGFRADCSNTYTSNALRVGGYPVVQPGVIADLASVMRHIFT